MVPVSAAWSNDSDLTGPISPNFGRKGIRLISGKSRLVNSIIGPLFNGATVDFIGFGGHSKLSILIRFGMVLRQGISESANLKRRESYPA